MDPQSQTFNWPHAPVHRLGEAGAYIVTAGTYRKEHFFEGGDRLTYLTKALVVLAQEYGLRLQAWAIFSNHYHLVGETERPASLVAFIQYLHSISAKYVNRLDGTPGRKVWHQYWDSHLTYHKSFLARLKYVHTNPVKHGLVPNAELYEWCSASWFARSVSGSFHATVMGFPSDRIVVPDDYDAAP
jgi:putative transposase